MSKSEPSQTSMLGEILPLVGTIAVAGPPVLFLALPWLLLALMLSGWVAVILTVVALIVVSAVVLAAAGALIATPFVLYRRHTRRVAVDVPVAVAPAEPVFIPAQVRVAA